MNARIFIILSIIALMISACSPASAPLPSFEPAFDEAPMAPVEELAERGVESFADFEERGLEVEERIVIKNGFLEIIVPDPARSMDSITRMAEEMGGFVVNANLRQTRLASGVEVPSGMITIRVPADRLNDAISRIEAESNRRPLVREISSQDVTREFTDLQSRLRNLEAAENQLIGIMETATRVQDVLTVYNELTRVREQIEVIKGQIQYYEQSARLSSIDIRLTAEEAVQQITVEGWRPLVVASNALQSLVDALQFLVTAAIWLVILVIPTLIVILLPVFVIIRLAIRWRNKRRGSPVPQPPA